MFVILLLGVWISHETLLMSDISLLGVWISDDFSEGSGRGSLRTADAFPVVALRAEKVTQLSVEIVISFNT